MNVISSAGIYTNGNAKMMMALDDNFKDQKSYYNPSNSG